MLRSIQPNPRRLAPSRRRALAGLSGAGLHAALASLGLLPAVSAQARQSSPAAFQARTLADALKALGVAVPADSRDLVITAADISDNGAVVDIGLASRLPDTEWMALLVERNPNPLACVYRFGEGAEPDLTMTIRVSESSDVVLVAKAGGRYWQTRRALKVTLGGCG